MVDFASTLSSTVVFLFEEGGGSPIGTAFIIGYPLPSKPDAFVPIVVTAKHVVGDYEKVVARFTAKSGKAPVSALYDLTELRANGDVWEHPDEGVDLIVFRTPHFQQVEYRPFPMNLIASKELYREQDIKATDRVIFPCLLVNFMGMSRNYPVVRDGSIALIPEEAVPLEYKVGTRSIRTNQQVILIDATSIPGASGSPVFLWPGPRLKGGAFAVGGMQPWLLGIMHGFYPALPRELLEVKTTGAVSLFQENSGIAIVFPSWRLLEILQRDEVATRIQSLVESSDQAQS